MDKPPDMAKAIRQLRPKVAKFFPALEGVEPVGVTSGVSCERTPGHRVPHYVSHDPTMCLRLLLL